MTRARFEDVLADLVRRGMVTSDDASALRTASRWPFGALEAAAALGGVLVGAGVLTVLGSLVEDLSQLAFAGVLVVLAALALGARRLLAGRARTVLACDLLEVVATGLVAVAAGIVLDRTGLRGEDTALSVALPTAALGAWRAPRTRLAGSVVAPVAAVVAGLAAAALVRDGAEFAGWALVLVGFGVLAWAARAAQGAPSLARLAGSVSVSVGTVVMPFNAVPEFAGVLAACVVAGVTFAFGARTVRLEVLVPSAVALTIAVTRAAGELVDGQAAQGATTIGVGVLLLAVTLRRLRAARTT